MSPTYAPVIRLSVGRMWALEETALKAGTAGPLLNVGKKWVSLQSHGCLQGDWLIR